MNDDMKLVLNAINTINLQLGTVNQRLDSMQSDIKTLDAKVDRNYDKTVEAFGYLMEHNTAVKERLDAMDTRNSVFEDQTIKNTNDIFKLVK